MMLLPVPPRALARIPVEMLLAERLVRPVPLPTKALKALERVRGLGYVPERRGGEWERGSGQVRGVLIEGGGLAVELQRVGGRSGGSGGGRGARVEREDGVGRGGELLARAQDCEAGGVSAAQAVVRPDPDLEET